jgi:hypothetical protein
MLIGYTTIYFSTNIYIIYLSVAIGGAGIGFCVKHFFNIKYLSPLRLAWKHFPERKGMITGIIMTGFGIGTSILNYISKNIINPNNEEKGDDDFYSEEIANRFKDYLIFILFAYLIVGICVLLMLIPVENDKPKLHTDKIFEYLINTESLNDVTIKEGGEINSIDLEVNKEELSVAVKSTQFWIITSMCFFSICNSKLILVYPMIILNILKTFGIKIGVSEEFLSMVLCLNPIINAFSKITWGILLDYISFKKLYLLCITMGIILSSTFNFIDYEKNNYIYFAYTALTTCVHGGFISLNPPMVSHIFGIM